MTSHNLLDNVDDLLRAERPDPETDAAQRVLHAAYAAPQRARRTIIPRRTIWAIAPLAASAAALAIILGGPLAETPQRSNPAQAKAAAIEALRAGPQTRFTLIRRESSLELDGQQRSMRAITRMRVYDDSMEALTTPTWSDNVQKELKYGPYYSLEIGRRTYSTPSPEMQDRIKTRLVADLADEASISPPLAGEDESQEFAIDGDRLAEILEQLDSNVTMLEGGGLEFRVTGLAKDLAPQMVTVSNGRLGLTGVFDPIGDEADVAYRFDAKATVEGTVRLDDRYRPVAVRVTTNVRGGLPGVDGAPQPRDRGEGSRSIRRMNVTISYDNQTPLQQPKRSDVTLLDQSPMMWAMKPEPRIIGRWSDLTEHEYQQELERVREAVRKGQSGQLTPETQNPSPANATALDAEVPDFDALIRRFNLDGVTARDLAGDNRCKAIDGRTARVLKPPFSDEDLGRATWKCSIGDKHHFQFPPGASPDAPLPAPGYTGGSFFE